MSISFIGIFVIFGLALSFLFKKIKKVFIIGFCALVFFTCFSNLGYFVILFGNEIRMYSFLSFYLMIISLILILQCKPKPHFYIFLPFVFACVSLPLMYVYPFSGYIITPSISWDAYFDGVSSKVFFSPNHNQGTFGLLLYFFETTIIFYCFFTVLSKNERKTILKTLFIIGLFPIVIGVLQFLEQNILRTNNLYRLAVWAFGDSGTTHTYLDVQGRFVAVNGLSREKAQFAFSCFVECSIAIWAFYNKQILKRLVSVLAICLSVLCLLFSMSF